MKLKEMYNSLPQEVKIFVEYILPSAVVTAAVDYLKALDVSNPIVALVVYALVNLGLIFLRNLKPRYERLKN